MDRARGGEDGRRRPSHRGGGSSGRPQRLVPRAFPRRPGPPLCRHREHPCGRAARRVGQRVHGPASALARDGAGRAPRSEGRARSRQRGCTSRPRKDGPPTATCSRPPERGWEPGAASPRPIERLPLLTSNEHARHSIDWAPSVSSRRPNTRCEPSGAGTDVLGRRTREGSMPRGPLSRGHAINRWCGASLRRVKHRPLGGGSRSWRPTTRS